MKKPQTEGQLASHARRKKKNAAVRLFDKLDVTLYELVHATYPQSGPKVEPRAIHNLACKALETLESLLSLVNERRA